MIILYILLLFVIVVGSYYLAVLAIKLWFGSPNMISASQKLHSIINGKPVMRFDQDVALINELWDNLGNILNRDNYNRMKELNKSIPLFNQGIHAGLPYIALTVLIDYESDKVIIEKVISDIVKKYLYVYGWSTETLVDWKKRPDINMDYIEIRYARDNEELKILNYVINCERNNPIIMQKQPVYDEFEEEDIDE